MAFRTLTLLLAACLLSAGATAAEHTLKTLVEATELSPSNLIVPQSTNGFVTFRPCAEDCDADYERARLTDTTQFSVNGEAMNFEDFKKGFAIIKAKSSSYALVSVDLETKTIVSIQLEG